MDKSTQLAFAHKWDIIYDMTLSVKEDQSSIIKMAPTIPAACALEILGWIIEAFIVVKDIANFELSTIDLFKWVNLIIEACNEDQPLSAREAASNSIFTSNILPWLNNLALESFTNSKNTNNTLFYNKLPNLSCKLWIVTLTLMQDDDEDVRNIANTAISNVKTSINNIEISLLRHTSTISSLLNQEQLKWMLPGDYIVAEGLALDNMSDIMSLSLAWSIKEPLSYNNNKDIDIKENIDLSGSSIYTTELLKLSGSTNNIQLLLNQKNNPSSGIIFEPEESNLYIEKIVSCNVISRSIGKSLSLLLSTSTTLSDSLLLLSNIILSRCDESLDILKDVCINKFKKDSRIDPELFLYFFSRIHSAQEVLISLKDHKLLLDNESILENIKVKANEILLMDVCYHHWINNCLNSFI
jgi:hypothetical protein